MSASKAALRAVLRARRRAFAEQAGAAALHLHAIVIARLVLANLPPRAVISGYIGNGREVDAIPALELAYARGLSVALPHIAGPGQPMHFLAWRPGETLVEGPYGIRQPRAEAPECAPSVILTPLVGFDRTGNRLGQGGGFYDRAFAAHPAARRIGLAWSVQEEPAVPVDAWDKRLHAIVTEREWMDCA